MPQIEMSRVGKQFGATEVIKEFTASIDDGEFLVLLGPSGCGKSTLLRMIAGLSETTSGTISFDDQPVNDWDVRRRDIAFVFQSYALYPQMTVRQNIAFPLLMDRLRAWQHLPIVSAIARRRMSGTTEVKGKVESIAAQLGLLPLLDRRPARLSGGQRQRVALARALVRDPAVYLFDEPLSNLDAQLRTQMRNNIAQLHRTVGKTFIYVTHDQVEAMTMATKIIILDKGVIQQIGTPQDLYARPANTFVARFIGSPPMNLLDGAALYQGHSAFGGITPDEMAAHVVGVRPEHIHLGPAGDVGLAADVSAVENLGAETIVGCNLAGIDSHAEMVYVRIPGQPRINIGERVSLSFDPEQTTWFEASSGVRSDTPPVISLPTH